MRNDFDAWCCHDFEPRRTRRTSPSATTKNPKVAKRDNTKTFFVEVEYWIVVRAASAVQESLELVAGRDGIRC
jgi:hypothetical protein